MANELYQRGIDLIKVGRDLAIPSDTILSILQTIGEIRDDDPAKLIRHMGLMCTSADQLADDVSRPLFAGFCLGYSKSQTDIQAAILKAMGDENARQARKA